MIAIGTMPSPKSRENGFYYSHPQNRFWKVMAALFQEPVCINSQSKKAFLLRRHIALWDVLQSCEISGADDASIRKPKPNDIAGLLSQTNITHIFTTGKKASDLYRRFCFRETEIESIYLPSTSPANCGCKWETLIGAYQAVTSALEQQETVVLPQKDGK